MYVLEFISQKHFHGCEIMSEKAQNRDLHPAVAKWSRNEDNKTEQLERRWSLFVGLNEISAAWRIFSRWCLQDNSPQKYMILSHLVDFHLSIGQ